MSVPDSAVDTVAHSQVSDRPRRPIRHQDRRITLYAIYTLMLATSVGVDGVAEHHPGGLGDLGHDRLGLDLVEGHAAELGGVERPGDRVPLDQRERGPAGGVTVITSIESEDVPEHTSKA